MSAIIKAALAGEVRAFDPVPAEPPAAPTTSIARSATELALDDAREEIARLQAELLAAGSAARDARDEAYAAGLKEGAESAADDAERHAAGIVAMSDAALAAWRDRLDELDALAATLAAASLARIFAPHADLADLVARAITARLALLRAESVLAVRVSGKDFADPAALAAAAGGVEVLIDKGLKPGQCLIDLRLGAVDLSIDRLARELGDFLASLDETA